MLRELGLVAGVLVALAPGVEIVVALGGLVAGVLAPVATRVFVLTGLRRLLCTHVVIIEVAHATSVPTIGCLQPDRPSMTRPPSTALTRCVGDVQRFSDVHWGARSFVHHDDQGYHDLLDVAAIELLLADLGRRPTFRVVRHDRTIRPDEYTTQTRVGGAAVDDVADVDQILGLVAQGATVVMQGLQRTWPPLAEFCLALESELDHSVQANAYLSPPTAAGLVAHADNHDVIVLQVDGSKTWEIEGLGTVHLAAGDAMYLPAGTQHAARTGNEPSLHITLGLLTTTYRDVMRRIVATVADVALDKPLPIGFTGSLPGVRDRLTAELEEAFVALSAAFLAADSGAVADREVERRRRQARRRPLGRLGVAVDPSSIEGSTELRRVADVVVLLDGESVVLKLSDRRVTMPGFVAAALQAVAERATIRPNDLPGLDLQDRLVLARRLIREGVLAPPLVRRFGSG